jgi:glycine/D-amino acid oxidase-like deaminating enzyme
MRTRYGLSPWIASFPSQRRPEYHRLRGEHTTTVVIIGGGLTGCAVAYACAVAGLRPILLESERIGHGSAGRSAGLLLPEPGPSFRDLTQLHGVRTTRHIFEGWRRASLDAAALLKRLGVRCSLVPRENLAVGFAGEEKPLRRELDARVEAGLDATWLPAKQARHATALEASAGMKIRDTFLLDPYRATLGLAAAAVKRKAQLCERTPVTKVRAGQRAVEVTIDGGSIRAATVIVTTGTATAEFQPLRRHFKAREKYLVLTEPVPGVMRKQLGRPDVTLRDLRSPHHRLVWTRDDRILMGGADQDAVPPRTRDAVLVQRTGQLMYELLTMYPIISGLQPEYGWELPYGLTADGVSYIGAHRNYPRHLFALGGSGDSIAGAFLSARILMRALGRAPEKADAAFGWTR